MKLKRHYYLFFTCKFNLQTETTTNDSNNNTFSVPVSVTLLANREVSAVVKVVVAAVIGREHPANIRAR